MHLCLCPFFPPSNGTLVSQDLSPLPSGRMTFTLGAHYNHPGGRGSSFQNPDVQAELTCNCSAEGHRHQHFLKPPKWFSHGSLGRELLSGILILQVFQFSQHTKYLSSKVLLLWVYTKSQTHQSPNIPGLTLLTVLQGQLSQRGPVLTNAASFQSLLLTSGFCLHY